jgi:hypothetical protein
VIHQPVGSLGEEAAMKRLISGVDPLVFWGSVGAATAFVLWLVDGSGERSTILSEPQLRW